MKVFLHPSDQPLFALHLRSAGVAMVLSINGVPVFADASGKGLNLSMPVNEWLFQGTNNIEVTILPLPDTEGFQKGAVLKLAMCHKLSGASEREWVEIGAANWEFKEQLFEGHQHHVAAAEEDSFDEDEAVLLAMVGQPDDVSWLTKVVEVPEENRAVIEASMTLPPPWFPCPWAGSQTLPPTEQTRFAVLGLTRNLHGALKSGNLGEILQCRREHLSRAYYLDSEKTEKALTFPQLVGDPNWVVRDLPEDGLILELAGGARLARVLNKSDGDSPLVLVNESLGACVSLDVWWRFQGGWRLL